MATTASPRLLARVAGLMYLIVIAGGAFAEAFVRQRLIVPRDAATTAGNVLANEQLYRWAFAADFIPLLCNMVLAAMLYALFKIVNRHVAALVVFFLLVGTAVQAAALLFHVAPLLLLKGNPGLSALDEPTLQALAFFSLRLQTFGYTLSLIFFGCFGLAVGYLVLCSTFMPRLLGVMMVVAGFVYTVNSFAAFVAPSLTSFLFLLIVLAGEGPFALWLFFVGVNDAKWRRQAELAASS